jgi:hypothetical protein
MLPASMALHHGEIQDYLAADMIDLLCGQPRVWPPHHQRRGRRSGGAKAARLPSGSLLYPRRAPLTAPAMKAEKNMRAYSHHAFWAFRRRRGA